MIFRKTRQARIERLMNLAPFRCCPREELVHIDSLATEIDVEAGRALIREGRDACALFVIVDGEATISFHGKPSGCLQAGGFFGELGLLDRGPDTETITAVTPMKLLVFGSVEFAALITNAPAVSRTIMRTLAARVRVAANTVARLRIELAEANQAQPFVDVDRSDSRQLPAGECRQDLIPQQDVVSPKKQASLEGELAYATYRGAEIREDSAPVDTLVVTGACWPTGTKSGEGPR